MLRLAIGLAFIVVPMLELLLLIKVGQNIGALPTLALVVGTALTGAFIISRQSRTVVARTLEALSQGRPPVQPVVDGLFLMAAGILMLTPGLITDVVGLALLVPPLRRLIARAVMAWALSRTEVHIETFSTGSDPGHWRGPADDGTVIEGEFERIDERPAKPRGNSGRRPSA